MCKICLFRGQLELAACNGICDLCFKDDSQYVKDVRLVEEVKGE